MNVFNNTNKFRLINVYGVGNCVFDALAHLLQ